MSRKQSEELLYGPYKAPRVRIGSELECAMRGPVRVKCFSAGPVKWPCLHRGGRPGFILCGDLVRAVQTESLAAVEKGWGVRRQTVVRWRKALGVGRVTMTEKAF
jgi:hypothetical protein